MLFACLKDVISECRNTESMNCHKDEVQKLMIYLLGSKRFEYNITITAIGQMFNLGRGERVMFYLSIQNVRPLFAGNA